LGTFSKPADAFTRLHLMTLEERRLASHPIGKSRQWALGQVKVLSLAGSTHDTMLVTVRVLAQHGPAQPSNSDRIGSAL
jgi:hypothetical protein